MQFGWKHNVIHGSFLSPSPSHRTQHHDTHSTKTQNFISYRKMCLSYPFTFSHYSIYSSNEEDAYLEQLSTLLRVHYMFHDMLYVCDMMESVESQLKLLVINRMLMDCNGWWISFYAVENWDISKKNCLLNEDWQCCHIKKLKMRRI